MIAVLNHLELDESLNQKQKEIFEKQQQLKTLKKNKYKNMQDGKKHKGDDKAQKKVKKEKKEKEMNPEQKQLMKQLDAELKEEQTTSNK